MRKTVVSILGIVILATVGFAAKAQTVTRPLPQLIQNLSDKDYAVWAQWQNRQANRRAEEVANDTEWRKYNYADRVISDSFSRGSTTMRSSTRTNRGGATSSATRNSSARANTNRYGGTAITAYKVRYLNPDYVGLKPVIAYNPWARQKGGLGTPDWASLFVPCKKDTVTMQEVLDRLGGPRNPEKVYKVMLEDYLGN